MDILVRQAILEAAHLLQPPEYEQAKTVKAENSIILLFIASLSPIRLPDNRLQLYLLDKEAFLSVVSEGNLTDLDAALAAVRYLPI